MVLFEVKHLFAMCETRALSSSDESVEEYSELTCLNMWNQMLELYTFVGPSLLRGLEDTELARVALTCHFALDVIHLCSSLEW